MCDFCAIFLSNLEKNIYREFLPAVLHFFLTGSRLLVTTNLEMYIFSFLHRFRYRFRAPLRLYTNKRHQWVNETCKSVKYLTYSCRSYLWRHSLGHFHITAFWQPPHCRETHIIFRIFLLLILALRFELHVVVGQQACPVRKRIRIVRGFVV